MSKMIRVSDTAHLALLAYMGQEHRENQPLTFGDALDQILKPFYTQMRWRDELLEQYDQEIWDDETLRVSEQAAIEIDGQLTSVWQQNAIVGRMDSKDGSRYRIVAIRIGEGHEGEVLAAYEEENRR